jgi:hypothetical protein
VEFDIGDDERTNGANSIGAEHQNQQAGIARRVGDGFANEAKPVAPS